MPQGEARTGIVVCHPHPLYGGEMHNNVVQALVDELSDRGHATLRFNFRGTGGSGGSHSGGDLERDDVLAAVAFLLGSGAKRVAVAGYSFGAAVGLQASLHDERVEALVGISLPIGMMDGSFLLECTKPKLLVAGDRDEFCPLPALEDLFALIPDPKRLEVVPGADHFWFGRDSEAARHAAAYLGEI